MGIIYIACQLAQKSCNMIFFPWDVRILYLGKLRTLADMMIETALLTRAISVEISEIYECGGKCL